jgi:hypothetical protein
MTILWEDIELCSSDPSMVTETGFGSMLFSNTHQDDHKINLEFFHRGTLEVEAAASMIRYLKILDFAQKYDPVFDPMILSAAM